MKTALATMLLLLPREFRERFGAEMIDQVCADYDRALAEGRSRALRFAVSTTFDVIICAVAERWEPSSTGARIEPTRREGLWMILSDWRSNFGQTFRSINRSPGFFALTAGMLGLALGATGGIFNVVDTVLLSPLPYDHHDRLVYIAASAPGTDLPDEFRVSTEFFLQYREQSELLEDVATFNSFSSTLRVDERVERVWMSFPTTNVFATLGVTPILGRLPVAEDEDSVVILSHALWTSWFGADPAVLGRSLQVADERRTVIGVMGPEFWFPHDRVQLWVPIRLLPDEVIPGRFERWFARSLVARTAPNVEHERLVEELGGLATRLPDRFGGGADYAEVIAKHQPIVRPLSEELVGDVSAHLWVLLGSVSVVLLIACANVANLFMVRAEHRQRELALRRALGANRRHLVRAQMTDAIVVATLAGVVAAAIAWIGVPVLLQAAPPSLPRLSELALTGRTLIFIALAAAASAFLCGLVPAFRAAGSGLARLRDGGRGTTRRRIWGQNGLVVAQTALALVLLIGSTLLLRSFMELRNVDPGYDVDDVFTFQIAPEGEHLVDARTYARFHLDFVERIAALPGVESVGLVENVPLNEGVVSTRFRAERSEAGTDDGVLMSMTWAGGDYFETMGIDVLRGRSFRHADHISDLGNIIVSESAANTLWRGEDPIGRRLQRWSSEDARWATEPESWLEVVGVVEDVLQDDYRDVPDPLVYLPLVGYEQNSRAIASPAYVVKTTRADDIGPEIRALVREVAPHAPMYRVFTMEGLAAHSMVRLSFTMLAVLIASALALFLGTIGLYGVLSYVVAERNQELGVRLALGAGARRVQTMVVAQGARIVTIGVLLGTVVAFGATRALATLLFNVEPVDLATFVGMAVAMLVTGLLASYIPARRASNVDLIESLRSD